MGDASLRVRPRSGRPLVLLLCVALLGGMLAVVAPVRAMAAGTVLFQNGFHNRTVDGTGAATKPALISGSTNTACLSASGNTSTPPLLSCTSATDAQGSGKLRLTAAAGSQLGGVYGATSFPTSSGLDVTFNAYQYGGGGADGMSFVLAAVDPTNPAPPTTIGQGGGSLGYSPNGGVAGLPNAYLGVGLDVYGNYSAPDWQGTGCTSRTNITASVPGAVVVRGPGNGTVGYCGLSTSYAGTTASRVTLRATTRSASVVPVQVLINPGTTTFTSDTGQTVAAGTYKVIFTPVGSTTKNIQSGTLPTVPTSLYSSSTWLNANGYPKQLAFGFIGSTGGVTDYHEADEVKVVTFNAVAQLAVTSTSYVAPTPATGEPVSYVVTPSVQSGVDVNRPVTMTQTVPAGVTPLGAYGSGWTCAKPTGQTITCTTTASAFTNGTTLPAITVVAVVTGSGVTASTVQNGSTSAVSSENANPASATVTTPGTLPTAPSGLTLSPTSGATTGGGTVTISGTNVSGATAIEIGTTAEQQAGTPVVLLPCSATVTTACFTVSGGSLVVSSWPARSAPAAVGVRVVTLGVQGSATYTYAARPATPTAPSATAGTTSATVTWTAPDPNGSPVTGYVVTPYLGGVAQTPVTVDGSSTTRTVTGLTAGGSYTFTVAATNAYGTSAASPASSAVVPYTLPDAPTVTAVSAGTSSATLTWTAPSGTGFTPLTGYVVTPYVGTVAQTPTTFSGTTTTRTVTGLTPGTAYTFRVAAVNAAGTGPASASSAAVTPNASPSLTFAAPPSGEVGVAYSRQLTVNDGTGPYTWSVSAGALPAGLTLNTTTGLLSGTPTAAGTASFTVQVTDASGQSATRAVNLVVAARPTLTFTPASGEVGVAYDQSPTLSGGTAPFTWSVTAGSLPPGVSLDPATGALRGTPTTAGSYSVTVQVSDAFAQTASRTVGVVVAAQPTLGVGSSTSPQVGVAYSNTFPVTGGTGPYTWSVSAGSLPAGLALAAGTGALTGTPTTAGAYSATITVVDAFGQTASRTFAGTVAPGPLVITKTANASSTVAGGTATFTTTVANTGPASSDVSLTDPLAGVLDDATYNGDARATVGTVSYASPTLTWTGTLAPGATATITYSVRVANPVRGDQVLAGTVTSGTLGTNCASGSTDARCTATVTVSGLGIVKTANVASTTPGSPVRFTVTATNTGRTAFVGATFTDDLTGVLDDAAYGGDARASSGSVSFAGSALTWTGNLAAGAAVTLTYTVTVSDPDPGDRTLRGTVTSPTAGSVCPGSGPAASCTAAVTVLVPALSITDAAAVSTTTPGSAVPHTVTIANTGQTAYAGTAVAIALAGALDDAAYAGDASASSGGVGYDADGGTLTWTGDLAVGATATVTFTLTVANPDSGDRSLSTTASSTAAGSTCPPGSTRTACTSRVAVRVPALSITKTSDVSSTTPGSVVRWTVLVANTGQTPYTGAGLTDPLEGVLDDATFGGDLAATTGTARLDGAAVRWSGDLAVGATATVTYSVTVADPDAGDRSLTGTVVSTTPFATCAPGSADPRCTSTVPVLVPGLRLAVTTDVASTIPGAPVRYTVTATNTGQTAYTGVPVSVDLSGALDDAAYDNDFSASAGSLAAPANGALVWTLDLPVGASATATGSLTVRDPDPADRSLVVTAVSAAPGSACPTASADPACTSTVPVLLPGLTLTKTASVTTVQPGQPVTYTITATNDGQSVQQAASLTDPLAAVLTDATFDGTVTASTGTASYADGTVAWTGRLEPGQSATVAYTVVVRDPDPGDKLLLNTVVSSAPGSNCRSGSGDARCTSVVRVLVPQLTLAVTADHATTVPGALVGFTATLTNSGGTTYAGTTVEGALGALLDDAVLVGDVSSSSGAATVSGGVLRWSGSLAPGARATVTFSARVNAADVGDDLLTVALTSSASGSTCAAGGSDPRCRVTVPVARLVIERQAQETTATPGSTIHIPAVYTNTGQVPYSRITVVHPRGDSADDVYPTGADTASSGTLVRTDDEIRWTGDIAVGGSVRVDITRVVRDPDPGNHVITATITSDAPGNNCLPGSGDPRCTFRIPVLEPGLTITKSVDTSFVVPGGTARWTLTVANTGETPQTGATVVDNLAGVLDDATFPGDATASRGTLDADGSTLTWTGDLEVGASATITYSVVASDPGTGDKAMVNTVSSSAAGSSCPPGGASAACRVTVPVRTPALTITKTSDVPYATEGGDVVYTVTVANTGQTTYPAASFSDSLAGVLTDATYAGDARASSGTVGWTSPTLTWSGRLAPGESATVTYRVLVASPNSGTALRNTVVSPDAGSNCATSSTDARCTSTVSLVPTVALTVAKRADAAYAVPGGKLTYTLTATNSSARTIETATVTDPLGDVLDDAAYDGDVTASTGTATFDGSAVRWSGSLPTDGSVTLTYSVTVSAGITGNQLLADHVVSTTNRSSTNCVPGSTDARCTTALAVARLQIAQAYTETSTTPGSLVHLRATFTNTGRYPYTGVTVLSPSAGTVDDADPTGDQTATSGTLALTSSGISWTGNLDVGQTVTVTGTLTVRDPDQGDRLLTGTLVTDAPGSSCGAGSTDPACTARLPVLLPALSITKTADATSVTPGGTARFTITVANTGETAYAGASVTDSLVGVLDDAAYAGGATATGGTLAYTAPDLTWTGDLAVGASVTITYAVTANRPANGDKTMVNTVSSDAPGSTCPPGGGGAACRSMVSVLTPALTLEASTSRTTASPGDTVTYTYVATNTGQTTYRAASFTAPLAGLLDDAAVGPASATRGTVTRTASALTWTGGLAPGESATVTLDVVVADPVTGDFRLDQTLVSTNQGSTCPPAGGGPACTTDVALRGLRITNAADVATTQPRGVVTFTGVFTNTGQVPYYGLTVDDSFVGTGDDAVYGGDATATSGSLVAVPGSGIISWTGDLPVGASVTVTGTVTVRDPDRADHRLVTVLSTAASASNCAVGSSDPVCRTDVRVLEPGLDVRTTADTATVSPGGRVAYTLTLVNTGETDQVGVEVDQALGGVLDEATFDADATAGGGTATLDGTTLRWAGDVPRGQTVTVTFSVTVSSPALGDKLLVTRATSDAVGSTCPVRGTPAAACTSTVRILVPAFATSISADRTSTTPGGVVTWTVALANTGETDAGGAVVDVLLADVLDDATYAGDAVTSSGGVALAGSTLTWTGDLPVGASATVTFSTTATSPPTGDRHLVAALDTRVPGGSCGSGTGAPGCSATVDVLLPGLTVTTAASAASATPGDEVRLTITVTNSGETAYPAATVTTALADVLDDARVSGTPSASTGSVALAGTDLVWSGGLAVGATATITVTVVVEPASALGDHRLVATAVSDDAGSSCPAGGSDGLCGVSVAVLVPSLAVRTSADRPTTTPGGVVTWTTTITNDGETAQDDVTVSTSLAGLLAEATYAGDARVTGGGTLAYDAPSLTWTGSLGVGAGVSITYSVGVNSPATGDRELSTSVVSSAPGSTCPPAGTAAGCSAKVQVLVPALQITKAASTSSVVAGGTVQYTVTVVNTGQTAYAPATFRDDLAGVLDDATDAGDATATSGTVERTGDTLVWSGPLAVGARATITYSVVTTFPANGDHVLRNTAVSESPGSSCVPGTTRARCRSTVDVLVPALDISKTASATSVVAGGSLGYTVTATNTGQADYASASFSDDLAGVLDDARYAGDAGGTGGSVAYADGVLTWTGPLARGATVVLTYTVAVDPADRGDRRLVNTVTSPTLGSTCPADAPAPGCRTTTGVDADVLTLSGVTPSFRLTGLPGDTVQQDEAVNLTVTTNSVGGYSVSVQAAADRLTAPGTRDTIPVQRLGVRPSGDGAAPFTPVDPDQAVQVHTQDRPSAPGGDAVSNDYRVDIPFVDAAEYGTTLEYVATAR
ncbi:DUF7927 domain-containing protein [Microlunatus flavus]|uniref:Conserved repeat domain-containing protein n=1 Tax=Microlunatus flavus TaxID=1036181 RepID=A0A1H9N4Y8_9ACTN|nr:putative Ig domain-containing protein [Microlunatus flavus]SER30994.1 conserved repeat domain-containing protein [Microlunatus flavus]